MYSKTVTIYYFDLTMQNVDAGILIPFFAFNI